MSETIEVISYPLASPPRHYVIRYIHEPIMTSLMRSYRNSPLMQKLAKATSERRNIPFDNLLKGLRGELLIASEWSPSEYRLTHKFADSINDKLNTIKFMEQEIRADLEAAASFVSSHGYEKIDLGRLHWKLLIDIECLFFFCRSILDIFARLTKTLYKQISGSQLADSFHDQKTKFEKYAAVDREYFTHISQLSWFDQLVACRDDLSHKTSLRIIVEPGSEPYLQTTKDTKISFVDILTISSGVQLFAAYYQEHFSNKLQSCELISKA